MLLPRMLLPRILVPLILEMLPPFKVAFTIPESPLSLLAIETPLSDRSRRLVTRSDAHDGAAAAEFDTAAVVLPRRLRWDCIRSGIDSAAIRSVEEKTAMAETAICGYTDFLKSESCINGREEGPVLQHS